MRKRKKLALYPHDVVFLARCRFLLAARCTIAAIDRDGMYKAFRNAAKCGVGIELNADDMKCTDAEAEIVLRPYRIAQEAGCKFYMGSVAHHPKALEDAKAIFERAIDRLGLTEDEKFILA